MISSASLSRAVASLAFRLLTAGFFVCHLPAEGLIVSDPYWPTAGSAKLITPQWIGEPEVEAAILLSIDDMRTRQITRRIAARFSTGSKRSMAARLCQSLPTPSIRAMGSCRNG